MPFIGMEEISWYLKPFLLLFLISAVTIADSFSSKKTLLIALSFSLLGDIILMFADKGELFFILGIGAFLIAQIVYIILFRKQKTTNTITNKTLFWFGTIVIVSYFFILINTLYSKLGPLKIPVIVYGSVITTMLFTAFQGFLKWKKTGSCFVFIGALFFVMSDSFLAFNKFYTPIYQSDFFIMSTYIVAQFGIVYGILKLNNEKSTLISEV